MSFVNTFDFLYSSLNDRYELVFKVRINSIIRAVLRLSGNIIIPLVFRITSNNKKHSIHEVKSKKEKVIISLTSYPVRIKRLWITIESLLRQSFKPDKIILWLSKEQFSSIDILPLKLQKLQRRGLEIKIREDDLRSHKKYYYAFQEFPNDIIITVDDDVIYNTELLAHLMDEHIKFPKIIVCNHAAKISFDRGRLLPYKQWETPQKMIGPSFSLLQIGVGGVLYPPGSIHKEVLNSSVFKKLCLFADDIWLNFMAQLNGTPVMKTNYNSDYLPVLNWKNTSLHSTNISFRNDKQIADLRAYFRDAFAFDPTEAANQNKSEA